MNARDALSLRQRQDREQELLNQLRGTPILAVPPSSAEFATVRQILRTR
jgi:hypothetical protein